MSTNNLTRIPSWKKVMIFKTPMESHIFPLFFQWYELIFDMISVEIKLMPKYYSESTYRHMLPPVAYSKWHAIVLLSQRRTSH
jgi:hypothetical protein